MAVRRQAPDRADDIWDTPDDGNRYEVIDGQLFVTPPPVEIHQRGAGGLFALIWNHVRARDLGRVYFAPIGVVLDDENGVQPDLVYVSREREGIISRPRRHRRDRLYFGFAGVSVGRGARSGGGWAEHCARRLVGRSVG